MTPRFLNCQTMVWVLILALCAGCGSGKKKPSTVTTLWRGADSGYIHTSEVTYATASANH